MESVFHEDTVMSILKQCPYKQFKEGEAIPPFPFTRLQYDLWLEIREKYFALNRIDNDLLFSSPDDEEQSPGTYGIKSRKKRKREEIETVKKPATCYMLFCKARLCGRICQKMNKIVGGL